MTTQATAAAGLEGVVATSSKICYLDGERGVLAYCGYDIHDLARSATFEEVCYLLWHRRLPTRAELGDLQTELARARPLPEPLVRMMRSLPVGHTMDAVRTLVSALAHHDPDVIAPTLNPLRLLAVERLAYLPSEVLERESEGLGGRPDAELYLFLAGTE